MTSATTLRGGTAQKLRRLRPGTPIGRLKLTSWIAIGVIGVIVIAAVFAPLLAPYGPNELSPVTAGPSASHWFGTDSGGRDVFSRLLYGSRWSLAIGLIATAVALLLGALIGAIAATSRKWLDELIMRCLDVVMAFPGIALAAVLVAVFGRAIPVLILAIGFLYMPMVARVVRANVVSQYGQDYVKAEKVVGARRWFILTRHVAVNCAAPVLVFCTVTVADAIVFEASLSFIGAGIQPPNPSWGSVISDGKDLMLTGGWWATLFPGLLILITVLALNVLAEGVSDAWAAPSTRNAAAGAAAKKAEAVQADRTPEPQLRSDVLAAAARRLRATRRDRTDAETVLHVEDLAVEFPERHHGVRVVDGVSFTVRRGEVLGLIGESGCGKSLTSLAVMGLLPRGARVSGTAELAGTDLIGMSARRRRQHLGRDVAMIYQDALAALNPAMTIAAQLRQFTRRGGTRTPRELMELVNLDPDRTLKSFPHELSGGQRQRVVIAMALSRDPQLILADEPTTALDVTVQAQVMELLLRLQGELGFALVLVSHDLALIAQMVDKVAVMYGGRIVEEGEIADVVGDPHHHYTRGLLSSVLSLELRTGRPEQIGGVVPSPADFLPGCRFTDRCAAATEVCRTDRPSLSGTRLHRTACHHPAGQSPTVRIARTPAGVGTKEGR